MGTLKSQIARASGARAVGTIVILNDRGLHTRPSAELVRCASQFSGAEVYLKYRGQEVNGKSLLGILTLAAPRHAKIEVIAIGEGAEEALAAIETLAEDQFHILY